MSVILPAGYFPPISYFAYLFSKQITIETRENFVKQSIRSRCVILGANGPLNLLVPKKKASKRETINDVLLHYENDWPTLHWRSLEAAYRNSPYFEYYEDELRPFFNSERSSLLSLNLDSISIVCGMLNMHFEPELTTKYEINPDEVDMRSSWNKQEYVKANPVKSFPEYIQVFSDRHAFIPDLSILDLLFCLGPKSLEYLKELKLNKQILS